MGVRTERTKSVNIFIFIYIFINRGEREGGVGEQICFYYPKENIIRDIPTGRTYIIPKCRIAALLKIKLRLFYFFITLECKNLKIFSKKI